MMLTSEQATRKAWRIDKRDEEQDIAILCPRGSGGMLCQWVSGHYGGCVLGRDHRQPAILVEERRADRRQADRRAS